ncbi:TolC family outer membrane protein [Aurantiacibacter poecillastricola]|uniref:TolC family outer membrane protein n=1 Tax=Aurantiacibacter poecillastricola TaxID=3064385 RepID=UPI00273F32EB|nr:TolC family outer membrane protein [Aurantiacibacter sp. 219JJ12-13]MDP5260523.1 TolC family outer membrane protein [Aurantiacibacter sp. 219JJ12-13]
MRHALRLVTALAGATLIASPAMADTLKEALRQAYYDNPTLEAARAQQRATDESVPIQRAAGLPSLNTTGAYTEFVQQGGNTFTAPGRQVTSNLSLGVPIYQGGAVKNGIRAAENRVEAGRADLRGTESSIFTQVVSAYMTVILQEALVALSENNVEVLRINLEATSDRFQIGNLTRTDVAQSESRLALARGDLRTARANLISAREDYIALVGEAPTNLEPPPPLPNLPDSPDQAVEIALENNPDLIAARERAQAAGFDIEVAGAGRLPTLEVVGGPGYTNYLGSLGSVPGAGTVADQDSLAIQAGVRFTVPFFQGGRVAAQQRQATAQAEAALEQVIATERSIIAQVRAAYSSWRAANAIISSSQAAVDAAALSLEGVRAENTVGNRTVLDILDAQQELLRAQVQLVTARRNAYVAGFSLLAAMGKAEARDLGLADEGVLYDPIENYDRVRDIIWDWQRDPDPVVSSTRTVDIPAPDGEVEDGEPLEEFDTEIIDYSDTAPPPLDSQPRGDQGD